MKDPAFLFYSKDFYEGTRMMLPEERACYIDLLIYQHQHGTIPNDIKRMSLYCSGIDEATLKATLEAKFKLTDKGWINERLNNEVLGREKFKNTQSDNGKIGQFWKKAKNILKQKEFSQLCKELKDKELILTFINDNEINIDTLKGLLKHCLNNKGNVSGDGDNNEKGEAKKIIIPTLEEFGKYALSKKPNVDKISVKNKYEAWIENGWRDGFNKPIQNWKSKLLNTLDFLKESTQQDNPNRGGSPNKKAL